jgi:hypothetical protein
MMINQNFIIYLSLLYTYKSIPTEVWKEKDLYLRSGFKFGKR